MTDPLIYHQETDSYIHQIKRVRPIDRQIEIVLQVYIVKPDGPIIEIEWDLEHFSKIAQDAKDFKFD